MSAQLLLAQQYEREGRHRESAALVCDAAKAGDAHAQFLWAARQLGGDAKDRREAIQLVEASAKQGHPMALHLSAVIAAAGFGRKQDWRAAVDYLVKAAETGDPRAIRQVELLGIPQHFDLAAWTTPPPARMQYMSPRIGTIEGFLAPQFCDWVVFTAKQKRMHRAQIIDPKTGSWMQDAKRTNTNAYLNLLESDMVTRLIKTRVAAAIKLPVTHQEDSNVLRYETGQVFDQHVDGLDPQAPGYAYELATFGQRVATFLIYLNDDFDGGETAFPLLDWRYRGKKGDAIYFWNVDEAGSLERKLLHAGRPPVRGEKWIFSQWVRDRPVEGAELPSTGYR